MNRKAGTFLVIGSLLIAATPVASAMLTPVSATVQHDIELHNDRAVDGVDCPDNTVAYWHFILAPNNGTSAFVSITLNLGTESRTFTGSQILKNGTQTDNVFVLVPDGFELDDLVAAGSSAVISGDQAKQFNLSHRCVPGTTTTTSSTTTSTVPETTTTSSTVPETTTTSSTVPETTTTTSTIPETTTTTGPAVLIPPATLAGPAPVAPSFTG
jgi:hypothetical protein